MTMVLAVALGGAVGAAARYMVVIGAVRLFGTGFPWGTVVVNVAGSFLMGVLVAMLAAALHPSETLRGFLATGVLGGFTTFSAFSLDTISLLERGETGLALAYVLGSVMISVAALACGLAFGRMLLG